MLNVKNHGKWPTAVAEAAASAPWNVTNIPWVRIFAPRSGKACLPSTLIQKLLFNCTTFRILSNSDKILRQSIYYYTCNVVLSVSIGVIRILQSPADIDAAPVFAAIGMSYG